MRADLLASWNHAAACWADLLMDRALAGGAVLLVVAVVAATLRRRASAHLLSWLWLLPLLPLALPLDRLMPEMPRVGVPARTLVTRFTSTDLGAAAPARDPVRPLPSAARVAEEGAHLRPPPARDAGAIAISDGAGSPHRPSLLAWALLTWASVAAALLLRLAVRQRRTSRDVAAFARLNRNPACRMMEELRRVAGVARPVGLVVSDTMASPATWGWRRPIIILPHYVIERLGEEQLRWVLLHELAHVRRCDALVALLQRLVTILWWFNPLVWLTNAAVECHRECACDDAASSRCGTRSHRSCAEAFFEIVAGSSRPRHATPALANLVDHRGLVRKRLMRLLDAKRPVPAGLTPLSAAALLACAALSLTVARSQAPAGEARQAAGSENRAAAEIDRAVAWLCAAQEADGRWRVSREAGRIFNGLETETSTTAGAVLALIEAAPRVRSTEGSAAIDRGITWLVQQQDEDGSIGPRKGAWTYGHAMGTLALCAAQRRDPRPDRLDRIARAASFIQKIQNPGRGWRYGYRDGDNDSKMTSLMMLALLESRAHGVEVAAASITWGLEWISSMTDPETGRVGWMRRGSPPGRLVQTRKSHPAKLSEEVTALATVAAIAAGRKPDQLPVLRKGIDLVLAQPPEWSVARGTIDYAYWYWGARLAAGLDETERDAWRTALISALVPHASSTAIGGLWPLADAWSQPGLEVYATAACLRSLCAIL